MQQRSKRRANEFARRFGFTAIGWRTALKAGDFIEKFTEKGECERTCARVYGTGECGRSSFDVSKKTNAYAKKLKRR